MEYLIGAGVVLALGLVLYSLAGIAGRVLVDSYRNNADSR
jgi:hypothetical protein